MTAESRASENIERNHGGQPRFTRPRPSDLSPLRSFCLDQHPRVFVPVELVRQAGGGNAGLILAQINYWFSDTLNGRSAGCPRARAFVAEEKTSKARTR